MAPSLGALAAFLAAQVALYCVWTLTSAAADSRAAASIALCALRPPPSCPPPAAGVAACAPAPSCAPPLPALSCPPLPAPPPPCTSAPPLPPPAPSSSSAPSSLDRSDPCTAAARLTLPVPVDPIFLLPSLTHREMMALPSTFDARETAKHAYTAVIGAWRRPAFIGALLDALLSQSFPPSEIIISMFASPRQADYDAALRQHAEAYAARGGAIPILKVVGEPQLGYFGRFHSLRLECS